jgi:ribosomal protein S18 acetylase RimI-like enzyme
VADDTTDVLDRLEHFYDALPRDVAHPEEFGGLTLFVRDGIGWSFYARPRRDAPAPPSAADIIAVRERQRKLALPEAFEWVHELNPDLIAVARSAGLTVLEAPLMVLDPAALPPATELSAVPVRILDPTADSFEADLAARRAVAAVGFGAPGTATGDAGPTARDAALTGASVALLREERDRALTGLRISALAESPDEGVLASGMAMRVEGAAEIAGVATLPAARRRGLGAAVTVALARRLLDDGVDLVFLSAANDDVARIYVRAGFRRIGTACIAEPAAVIA